MFLLIAEYGDTSPEILCEHSDREWLCELARELAIIENSIRWLQVLTPEYKIILTIEKTPARQITPSMYLLPMVRP